MENYFKELDEVLLTKDARKLKEFTKKHDIDIGENDRVIEATLHKTIVIRKVGDWKDSAIWLILKGYSLPIDISEEN